MGIRKLLQAVAKFLTVGTLCAGVVLGFVACSGAGANKANAPIAATTQSQLPTEPIKPLPLSPTFKAQNQTVLHTYIQSDPLRLIDRTELQPELSLTPGNYLQFEGATFIVKTFSQVKEKSVAKDFTRQELESEAAPTLTVASSPKTEAHWSTQADSYMYTLSIFGTPLTTLIFKIKYGRFYLSGYVNPKSALINPLSILHYSMAKDGSAFSILYNSKDSDGQNLLSAIYFSKPGPANWIQDPTALDFNYLMGPGVKIAWDNQPPIELSICGDASHLKKEIRQAVRLWNEPLKDRAELKLSVPAKCPPFSDLNVHGIYLISDYRTLESTKAANYATTYSHFNSVTGNWLDSDIILNKAEFEKTLKKAHVEWSNPTSRALIQWSLNHELGHLLGLDHQFKVRSVMGYDSKNSALTNYDISAIQTLYPLKLATAVQNK